MAKNKKKHALFRTCLDNNRVFNCRYTYRVLRLIVDKHTYSTKIALHCCFGRFL